MQLAVNPAGDLPIYRQIMRQITDAIAGGRLKPGERVPSHRELSEQLAIAPLTVKKAYDELEALGYLETHRGSGTYVSTRPPRPDRAAQRQQIEESARQLLAEAYMAGLRLPDVVQLLREADRAIKEKV